MAKKNPWVCKECGSKNVDQEGWVNVNTLKYQDSLDERNYYCCNCDNSGSDIIITLKDYKLLQKTKK